MMGQLREIAVGMAFDPAAQIDRVHAVDADQQHMFVAVSGMRMLHVVGLRDRDAARKYRARDRGG
jgi:hypothetical protein